MANQRDRNSNIELLRVVSMLMIVLHHFSVHGSWGGVDALSSNIALHALAVGGKLGVACFVIITGYFMVKSEFRMRSVLKITFQTWFYSWLIFAAFSLFKPMKIPDGYFLEAIAPIIFGEYWFVTCYIALILLSPALNRLILSLDETSRARFTALSVVMLSIIPTISTKPVVFSNLLMFLCFYIIGAEIRMSKAHINPSFNGFMKYVDPVAACRHFKPLLVSVASFAIILAATALIDCLKSHGLLDNFSSRYFMALNSAPLVFLSVGLFTMFERLDIGSNRFINLVASGAFGVYLIHDNPLVRRWLWPHFESLTALPWWQIALCGIGISLVVYVVCWAVDYIRQNTFERPTFKLIDTRLSKRLASIDTWFRSMG